MIKAKVLIFQIKVLIIIKIDVLIAAVKFLMIEEKD